MRSWASSRLTPRASRSSVNPWIRLSRSPFLLSITSIYNQQNRDVKPSRSSLVDYSAVRAARTVVGSSSEPPPMPMDTSAGTWIKKAQLPCWPLYSQQVSHQRWIWGIHCVQARKHTSEGIHPGFETQGRCHQKSKIGVSVAPWKGPMSSKN